MILAAADWQPYAIVATFLGTCVTAAAMFLKGRTDAGVTEKANEALSASTMATTAFKSLEGQMNTAVAGQKDCEQRCDQLRDELLDTRAELHDTQSELRATQSELRGTKETLRDVRSELSTAQTEIRALRGEQRS